MKGMVSLVSNSHSYTGKNCQYELDPCNPAECMNGGSCVGNSTHFRCECTAGFTGPLCQHSLNECESSPCFHGICVDQEDGFRCFCQPVFCSMQKLFSGSNQIFIYRTLEYICA
uniref:EGF-like domain-containing protein n=1 Tax=Glossina brevipalpis TaxID=37001 RepID=A0A1A9WZP1_9MUSC